MCKTINTHRRLTSEQKKHLAGVKTLTKPVARAFKNKFGISVHPLAVRRLHQATSGKTNTDNGTRCAKKRKPRCHAQLCLR